MTVVMALVALLAVPAPASASPDHSSFFSEPELAGAGWATCEPITWSVDTRGLSAQQSRREIARLRQAWRLWTEVSGKRVVFVGRERLAYDAGTLGLRAVDRSAARNHHVHIAFKTRKQVPILSGGAVGLGKPTLVFTDQRRIVGGMVILLRGYAVQQDRRNPAALVNVYAHEFGHVLGLGHAQSRSNVMYPEVTGRTRLGPGDAQGIARITQPCRT
jgi:hypothetical protein